MPEKFSGILFFYSDYSLLKGPMDDNKEHVRRLCSTAKSENFRVKPIACNTCHGGLTLTHCKLELSLLQNCIVNGLTATFFLKVKQVNGLTLIVCFKLPNAIRCSYSAFAASSAPPASLSVASISSV